MSPASPAAPVLRDRHDLLFDGDCGVCNRVAELCRQMDHQGRFRVVPYQSIPEQDLRPFGLDYQACQKKVQIISRAGTAHSGAFAVNFFLWHHFPWSVLVVLIYALPPLLLAEIIGYALVSRYRYLLSGWLGLTACKIR